MMAITARRTPACQRLAGFGAPWRTSECRRAGRETRLKAVNHNETRPRRHARLLRIGTKAVGPGAQGALGAPPRGKYKRMSWSGKPALWARLNRKRDRQRECEGVMDSIPRLTLVVLLAAAGWLTSKCVTKPAGPKVSPPAGPANDRVWKNTRTVFLMKLAPVLTFSSGFFHAYLAYSSPNFGSVPGVVCPHPERLNPKLYQWTPFTTALLAICLSGGVLRLLSIAQLGRSFSWELAAPVDGLVTSGMYRYIRHPSYTGMMMNLIPFVSLFFRVDGNLACYLPGFLSTSRILILLPTAYTIFVLVRGFITRINDEEVMMHKEFGKKWEEYCRHTTKVIPVVL